MSEPEPRVALVTGAARRVGAAIVRRLHEHGMNVAVHYRGAAEAASELRDALEARRPGSVELVQADLRDPGAPEAVVEAAHRRWRRLDAVVNNASVFVPTPVHATTREQWHEVLGANLEVPFFLSQAAAPYLSECGGVIVNLTDIHAERPLKGYSVYCIAKAGLVMLTRSLARELAPAVRVNAVAPGVVLWPELGPDEPARRAIAARVAIGREGDPDDVARAVLFLVADASYVTGQVLTVDGGRSLMP
jgi:pteridine reductase